MAGVQEEISSFISKFQQLCYNGIDAYLHFSSWQGSVYVNCYANLGHFTQPPQPLYASSYQHNFNLRKPSRIRRRKRREEKRKFQRKEDNATENLLDLDENVLTEASTIITETSLDNEELSDGNEMSVNESNYVKNATSSPNQEFVLQDHYSLGSSSTTENSKYWEQMYGMLKYLTEKNCSFASPGGGDSRMLKKPLDVPIMVPTTYQR